MTGAWLGFLESDDVEIVMIRVVKSSNNNPIKKKDCIEVQKT